MQVFAPQEISPNVAKTPDGFLLCKNVRIARTGVQIYAQGEIPVESHRDLIRVNRPEAEVFHPDTLASFLGKPVTNDHPDDDVTPENWRQYAVGNVVSVRRGEGADSDFIVADLLITDVDAMHDVTQGKRQVSCGYGCKYRSVEQFDADFEQYAIVGNHVALVDRARCGPVCSVRDGFKIQGDAVMKKKTILDRLFRAARGAKDEAAFEAEASPMLDDMEPKEGGDQHFHIGSTSKDEMAEMKESYDKLHKSHDERLSALEAKMKPAEDALPAASDPANNAILGELEFEAPVGTGAAARTAKDSAYLVDSFAATLAEAEILAPGIHAPTFDNAAAPVTTYTAICNLRRKALTAGARDAATAALIAEVYGSAPKDGELLRMGCGRVRDTFKAVVALKRRENNGASSAAPNVSAPVQNGRVTIAQINEMNRKRFEKNLQ